jgi:hypothetical protein
MLGIWFLFGPLAFFFRMRVLDEGSCLRGLSVLCLVISLCGPLPVWASLPDEKKDSFQDVSQDSSAALQEEYALIQERRGAYHREVLEYRQVMAEMEQLRKQIQQEREDMKRVAREQHLRSRFARLATAEQLILLEKARDEMNQNRKQLHAVKAMLELEDEIAQQQFSGKKGRGTVEQERILERFDEALKIWDDQQNRCQSYLETLTQHLQDVDWRDR